MKMLIIANKNFHLTIEKIFPQIPLSHKNKNTEHMCYLHNIGNAKLKNAEFF